jgi:hypothetical protein
MAKAEAAKGKRMLVLVLVLATGALALGLAMSRGSEPDPASAASHREAPAISLDTPADITDFFMFRSYESGKQDRVILLMDVMSEEPSSGPNYWNFDPSVLYELNIDNDRDGRADDVRFQFRFQTEIRGTVADADLFLSYLGRPGSPFPPITRLDGPGSEGLGLRQRYSVTMLKGGGDDDNGQVLARDLIAVPSNVGPFTMPSYEDLARQGTYSLANGMRVFAGQRQDPFYIDLGGLFDTFDFRRQPPALTPAEDEQDAVNPFGVDMLSGFNVHTIALEVPVALLMGKRTTNVLGAYASTSRATLTVRGDDDGAEVRQVQRLANPLVNEAIIGTEDKDLWNRREPHQERRFLDYYLNPRLALALQLIYGIPAATSNREDLVDLLLKYEPSDRRLSELLRLRLDVPPRPLAAQRRMTVLASPPDPAGWPNGRRPKDDVTDIAIRVVGGPNYVGARAGDGVNTDDAPLQESFPFLATPEDGANRQHDNP